MRGKHWKSATPQSRLGTILPLFKNTVGGSTGAMGGEADRNLDSLLYSHRLPLVVHLDMTYPCESHKFVSWRVILSTSCHKTIIFWIDSDI